MDLYLFTPGALYHIVTPLVYILACVAGGFKGLGFYGEGNYGVRQWYVFLIALAIISLAINPHPLKTAGYAGYMRPLLYVVNLSEHELNEEKRLVQMFAISCA